MRVGWFGVAVWLFIALLIGALVVAAWLYVAAIAVVVLLARLFVAQRRRIPRSVVRVDDEARAYDSRGRLIADSDGEYDRDGYLVKLSSAEAARRAARAAADVDALRKLRDGT